jgi:putative ABC transport system permease protein
MKAIGLPHSTIANLYLAKYFILMLVACVAGGTLATLAAVPLTRSIATNYAAAPIRPTTFFVPLIALTLLFCLVLVICRALLSKINRIEVVNAMVHGSTLSTSRQIRANRRRAHRMSRSVFSRGSLSSHINYRLALVDLRRELRRWLLLPLVFLLATVLMTLPTNLLTTLTSPQFATYMGGVDCDIRFDLQFSDDIDQVRTKLLEALEQDARITTVHQYAEQLVEIDGLAGPERLRVAVGDYSGETVAFTEGHPPRAGEIAFSVLNAEKYHLDVGDQLTVNESTQKRNLVISGIYQDITSGGYTAKMQGIPAAGASRYVLYADTRRDSNVSSSTHPKLVAQAYQTQFPSVSIVPMQEYVGQTLSHLTSALSNAAVIAVVFALGVSSLITFFYLGLQLSRDRQRLGVLAALGFSNQELDTQMRVKALIAVFSGVLLGLATTVTLGQALVGSAFALTGLGISDLAFSPSLGLVFLLYPLLLIAVGFLSTLAVGTGLRRSNPIGWVRS